MTSIESVSPCKFHTLLYELSVGFEVTFPLEIELQFDPSFAFRDPRLFFLSLTSYLFPPYTLKYLLAAM